VEGPGFNLQFFREKTYKFRRTQFFHSRWLANLICRNPLQNIIGLIVNGKDLKCGRISSFG
jgi:hypothetical protein